MKLRCAALSLRLVLNACGCCEDQCIMLSFQHYRTDPSFILFAGAASKAVGAYFIGHKEGTNARG